MEVEVAEGYRSSLKDLAQNSKPLINMLTMLADDHEQHASVIIDVIEEHIQKVKASLKLPVLYLIDSIIKNLQTSSYRALFPTRLVKIFCEAFEEVDEKTRQAMFKLRQTWTNVIPNNKLYAIDVRVNATDPAWPITATPPEQGSIHVNPKFLTQDKKMSPAHIPLVEESAEAMMRRQLLEKQQELQKLKLELELAETTAKLEQQRKQLEMKRLNVGGDSSIAESKKDPRTNRDPRRARDPRKAATTSGNSDMVSAILESSKSEPTLIPVQTAPPIVTPFVIPKIEEAVQNKSYQKFQQQTVSRPSDPRRAYQEKTLPNKDTNSSSKKSNANVSNKSKSATNNSNLNSKKTTPQKSSSVHKVVNSTKPIRPFIPIKKSDTDISIEVIDVDEPKGKLDITSKAESRSNRDPRGGSKNDPRVRSKAESRVGSRDNHGSIIGHESARVGNLDKEKSSASSRDKDSSMTSRDKHNSRASSRDKDHSQGSSRDKDRSRGSSSDKDHSRGSSSDKDRHGSRDKERVSSRDGDKGRSSSRDHRDYDDRSRHSPRSSRTDEDWNRSNRKSNKRDSSEMLGRRSRSPASRSPRSDQKSSSRSKESHEKKSSADPRKKLEVEDRKRMSPKVEVESDSESIPEGKKRKLDDDIEITNSSHKQEDLSGLFGTEDIDYRTAPTQIPFKSPGQKGWAKFKENHPEDYQHERRRSNETDMDQDIDLRRRPSIQQSPPVHQSKSPIQSEPMPIIPEALTLENQEAILKVAEQRLLAGIITHQQHQDVLKQLSVLYTAQRSYQEKAQKLEREEEERRQEEERRRQEEEERRRQEEEERRRQEESPRKNVFEVLMAVPPVKAAPSIPESNKMDVDEPVPKVKPEPTASHVALGKKSIISPDKLCKNPISNKDVPIEVTVAPVQDIKVNVSSPVKEQTLSTEITEPVIQTEFKREVEKLKSPEMEKCGSPKIEPDFDPQMSEGSWMSPPSIPVRESSPLRDSDFTSPPHALDQDMRSKVPDMEPPPLPPSITFNSPPAPQKFNRPSDSSISQNPEPHVQDKPYFGPLNRPDYLREDRVIKTDSNIPNRGYTEPLMQPPRNGPYDPRAFDTAENRDERNQRPRAPRDVMDGPRGPYPQHSVEKPIDRPLEYMEDGRGPPYHERMDVPVDPHLHNRIDRSFNKLSPDRRDMSRDSDMRDPRGGFIHANKDAHLNTRNRPMDFPHNSSMRSPQYEDRVIPPQARAPRNGPVPLLSLDIEPPVKPIIPLRSEQDDVFHGHPSAEPNSLRSPGQDHDSSRGPGHELPRGPDYNPRGGPDHNLRRGPDLDIRRGPDHDPRRGPDHGLRRGPDHDPRRGPEHDPRRGPDYGPMRDPDQDVRRGPDHDPRRGPDHDPRRGPDHDPRRGPDHDPRRGPDHDPRRGPDHDPRRGPNQDLRRGVDPDARRGSGPDHMRSPGQDFGPVPDKAIERRGLDRNMRVPEPGWVDENKRPDRGNRRSPEIEQRKRNERPVRDRRGKRVEMSKMPPIDHRWATCGMYSDDEKSEVILNNRAFELFKDSPPRMITIGSSRCEYFADSKLKGITINRRLVYNFGEPPKDVKLPNGDTVNIFYLGVRKEFWIDGIRHEVRVDAPPKKITLGNKTYGIQIDGNDMMILIDRLEKGSFGGPPREIFVDGLPHDLRFEPESRQILVDGQACDLDLNRNIPVLKINGEPRMVRFDGPNKVIHIDDKSYSIPVDKPIKTRIGVRACFVALGGPGHEVIINGKWHEIKFDGIPREVTINDCIHKIALDGPIPQLKILDVMPPGFEDVLLNQGLRKEKFAVPLRDVENRNKMGGNQMPGPVNGAPMMRPVGPPQNMGMIPPNQTMGDRMGVPQPMNQMGQPMGPTMAPQQQIGQPPMGMVPGGMFQNQGGMMPVQNPMGMNPMQQGNMMNPGFNPPMQVGVSVNQPMPVQQQPSGVANVLSMLMPAQSSAPQTTGLGGLDLNSLFSKLVASGIIPKSTNTETSNTTTTVTAAVSIDTNQSKPKPVYIPNAVPKFTQPDEAVIKEPLLPIPDISDFQPHKLKKKYHGVVQRLYEGIQCSTCGIRFIMDDTERYREHLDWHFRQNKRQNAEYNMAKNRQWHYEIDDWIVYELIEESEEKTRSSVFEGTVQGGSDNALSFKIPEGSDYIQEPPAQQDNDNICCICGDPFEQFWHEENEDWHLRDALLVDKKYYHPVCFEDARDESVLEPTPTPTESPETNPLFNRRLSGPASMYTNVIPPKQESDSESTTSTRLEIRREIKTDSESEVKDEIMVNAEVKVETHPIEAEIKPVEIKNEPEIKPDIKTESVVENTESQPIVQEADRETESIQSEAEVKTEPIQVEAEVKTEPIPVEAEVKTEPIPVEAEVKTEPVPVEAEVKMETDATSEEPEETKTEIPEVKNEEEPMESS